MPAGKLGDGAIGGTPVTGLLNDLASGLQRLVFKRQGRCMGIRDGW